MEKVSVNGGILAPAPAGTGNLWQRLSLILMRFEYRDSPPVNHLLLGRYLPAGRPVPPDSLPLLFEQCDVGNVLELTSDDLAAAVTRVVGVESRLAPVDDAHLVAAISGLDFRLARSILFAGVKPGRKSLGALLSSYDSYFPEQSRYRREMLRVLLWGGLDPATDMGGKNLLHHICAGPAPAQDIGVILDDAGTREIINQRDAGGDTPLVSYCRRPGAQFPNRAGLTCLLEAGADPNISNGGETPCTLLRAGGNSSLAERLLDYGADS